MPGVGFLKRSGWGRGALKYPVFRPFQHLRALKRGLGCLPLTQSPPSAIPKGGCLLGGGCNFSTQRKRSFLAQATQSQQVRDELRKTRLELEKGRTEMFLFCFVFLLCSTDSNEESQGTRGNELQDEERRWCHHPWQCPMHPDTKGQWATDAHHQGLMMLSPEPAEKQASVQLQISLSWCQKISTTYWFRDYTTSWTTKLTLLGNPMIVLSASYPH